MAVSSFIRFISYGMLGFMYEIIFTAFWDFVASDFTDFQFRGYSSVWSFFIYGGCSYCGERFFYNTKDRVWAVLRGLVYVSMAYSWEFLGGLLLRQFSACTWDYTHFRFDIMGLIALEYAPFWFLAGLSQEYLYDYLLRLDVENSHMNEKAPTISPNKIDGKLQ